jgi:hypothetical protein
MLRLFACAALALTLVAGSSLAGQQGKGNKGHALRGTILKVDAEQGTLTVAVKSKKTETTREFTVSDKTKVVIFTGKKNKTELTGKSALKNDGFKEGATVTIVTDEDAPNKIKTLSRGKKKNKKMDQ